MVVRTIYLPINIITLLNTTYDGTKLHTFRHPHMLWLTSGGMRDVLTLPGAMFEANADSKSDSFGFFSLDIARKACSGRQRNNLSQAKADR